jgi:Arc/MetJ-type ribon-helix-helix transcriptional regulator
MPTTMITLKLEDDFLKEIDALIKDANYQNRTEFIREALREKLQDVRKQEAMAQLRKIIGSSKRKVSDEEYEDARSKLPDSTDLAKLFRLMRDADVPKR